MKHIIEVEETVKIRHQIFVDIVSEEQLEEALDKMDNSHVYDIDDYVDSLANEIPVLEVNENYFMDTFSVEYYDDYACEDDD